MRGRWVFVIAIALACSLYADSVVPPPGCGSSQWVHFLCSTGGTNPPNAINPFDSPISGNLNNLTPGGSPIVFIEGPWLGHRNQKFGSFEADWLAGIDSYDKNYGRTGNSPQDYQFATPTRWVVGVPELYSYYVRGVRTSSGDATYTGTLTFHFPVVAVVATNRYSTQENLYKLDKTNGLFGAKNSDGIPLGYGTGNNAAFGLDNDDQDWIMVSSSDRRTVTFHFHYDGPGIDSIRILTMTPEPAAVALFGTVAAVLFGAQRFRKRRRA